MTTTKAQEIRLVGEFDAAKWAEEFVTNVKAKPEIATDEDTMRGWFANAIMAGYDKRSNEEPPAKFAEVQGRNKAGSEMDKRWCPWKKDVCNR